MKPARVQRSPHSSGRARAHCCPARRTPARPAGSWPGSPVKEALKRFWSAIAAFAELEDLHGPAAAHLQRRHALCGSPSPLSVHVGPELAPHRRDPGGGRPPLSGRSCLCGYLEELRDNRVTILLTSHVASHVLRICPRTVWLQNGLVRLDGDTEQVIDSYQNMMRLDLPAPRGRAAGGLRTGTRRVRDGRCPTALPRGHVNGADRGWVASRWRSTTGRVNEWSTASSR